MAKNPPSFEEWTSSEAFYRWFWKGTNGNELIDRLNMHNFNQQGDKGCDRIRRESDSPTIYGLVINNDMDLGDPDWKLCKVSFTHLSTKPVSDENCPKNQIEKDKAEIEKIFPEVTVSVIFALPINFIDTTQVSKVEERLRNAIGFPVDKDLAELIDLPEKTEWVLTTQPYITVLKERIDKMKKKSLLSTKVILGGDGIKFDKRKKSKLPEDLHVSDEGPNKGQVCFASDSHDDLAEFLQKIDINSAPKPPSKSTPQQQKESLETPEGASETTETPKKSSAKNKGATPKRKTKGHRKSKQTDK